MSQLRPADCGTLPFSARAAAHNKDPGPVIESFLLPSAVLIATVVSHIVLVLFVMSLLFMFNVISPHHEIAGAIWRGLNAFLDPLLRPIRKLLPPTGGIDFSPLVLIVVLQILVYFLDGLARTV
jgi:YggT family protein